MEKKTLLKVIGLKTYFYSVTKHRFLRVVDDVSFDIGYGETVALFGESGSGKSRTAYSIMGIVPHTPGIVQGEVWFKGENLLKGLNNICEIKEDEEGMIIKKNVKQWNKQFGYEQRMKQIRGKKIALIMQGAVSALNPFYRVKEQIEEAYILSGRDKDVMHDVVDELMMKLHIKDKMTAYPHNLSGGMCQRVIIAMAMIAEPELLIADEPTTGIDPPLKMQIIKLLKEFVSADDNRALLFISHELNAVQMLAQRVVVMYKGEVVESGNISILSKNNAKHPYTQNLIEAHQTITYVHNNPEMMYDTMDNKGCKFYKRCNIRDKICLSMKPELRLIDKEERHYVRCWKV